MWIHCTSVCTAGSQSSRFSAVSKSIDNNRTCPVDNINPFLLRAATRSLLKAQSLLQFCFSLSWGSMIYCPLVLRCWKLDPEMAAKIQRWQQSNTQNPEGRWSSVSAHTPAMHSDGMPSDTFCKSTQWPDMRGVGASSKNLSKRIPYTIVGAPKTT